MVSLLPGAIGRPGMYYGGSIMMDSNAHESNVPEMLKRLNSNQGNNHI
jgi:hypothetical protein